MEPREALFESLKKQAEPNGNVRIILPWGAVVALLGVLGWNMASPGQKTEAAPRTPSAVWERLNAVESAQARGDAAREAQFGEILRRLDRIENRLDAR